MMYQPESRPSHVLVVKSSLAMHDLFRRLTTIEMPPQILPVWCLAMLLLTIHTTTGGFAFS